MRRFLLLPVIALAAGCQTKTAPLGAPPPTAANPPEYHPAATVELTPVSVAGLDAAVREHKGKVVLIDAWFLGCGPCVKRFPHVVELAKKYADDGLVVMSLDTDPAELAEKPRVEEFLTKQGAAFPNFILKDDAKAAEAWLEKYEADFPPAVVLFDRTGAWVKVPNKSSVEEIEVAVRTALRKK